MATHTMATTKVTFTFDDLTLDRLARTAKQLRKPKSAVVREAIRTYTEDAHRLSLEERQRLLRIDAEYRANNPPRPKAEVDREIAEVRRIRHEGGRRHPVE